MKIYFDSETINIVIEGIGRFLANGSLIAVADGDNISVSYRDTQSMQLYMHYSEFKDEADVSYGIDASTVVNALNEEFDKNMIGSDIAGILGYAPYDGTTNPNGYMSGVLDYANSGTTTSGNVIFYLTDNGLISGNALFTNVTYVNPFVNNSANNYTYSWTLSVDKKTLTVNAKISSQTAVALIGLTVVGLPSNVANGTTVYVLVKGN